jgi:hypothetical protein
VQTIYWPGRGAAFANKGGQGKGTGKGGTKGTGANGGGGGGGGAPSFRQLLLHLDGTNGSTTFTDSSPVGRVQTAANSATISTAQSKFGGASLTMSGSGKGVQFNFNDIVLAKQDWWIGFWYRTGSTGTRQLLVGQCDSGGATATSSFVMEKTAANRLRCVVGHNGTGGLSDLNPGAGSLPAANTWTWLTLGREGDIFRSAVDGVAFSTNSPGNVTVNSSTQPFAVGNWGDVTGTALNGFIDELIFEVGVYRGLDTPPAAPFT